MNLVIICNPVSGRGQAMRLARKLEDLARAHNHQVELIATKSVEHLREAARLISSSTDAIVCAGGDGTLNTLINALPDPGRVPLIQLATGTANLLARELGLPRVPASILSIIEAGKIAWFDLMRMNGESLGFLVASVGFDAMVIREIHENRGGALGFRGYFKPILNTMRTYQVPRLRIRCDDEEEYIEGGLVVVGNVKSYAAFFSITNQAQYDSGFLDVCIIPDARRLTLLRLIPFARRKQISRSDKVIYRRVRSAIIESVGDDEVAVEVDGEYFGSTPIEILVEPHALPVLIPG